MIKIIEGESFCETEINIEALQREQRKAEREKTE